MPIVHESLPIVATIGSETNHDIRAPSCVRPKILKVYVSAGTLSTYQVYHPGVLGDTIFSRGYVVTSWERLLASLPNAILKLVRSDG